MLADKPNYLRRERRRGPDVLRKTITWSIGACWLLLLVLWAFIYYARPEQPSIFDPHSVYHATRSYWDIDLIKQAFIVVNVLLLVSLGGLTISTLRSRRKSDSIPKTLIIMTVMSIIGAVLMYLKF